ncbi:MAG: hypothetical protein PVH84_05920 [Candidatus Aminicenantes bacterium]
MEGFSNFSWVILLSVFDKLGLSPLWVSKALSLLFSFLIIGLVFKTAQAFGIGLVGAILCSFLVSSATSLAYFAMSGLETVLYTFLLLLAVYLNIKLKAAPSRRTLLLVYTVCLLAAITRPEGILFLLVSSAYYTGQGLRSKRWTILRTHITFSFFFLSLFAGFVLLRLLYYGNVFPNTFYAKPPGSFVETGYSAFFVNFSSGMVSGSFLLIPLVLFSVKRKFLARNLYPLLFCLVQVIFMSYTGDWMAFGRFFFPIFPLVVILCLTFLSSFRPSSFRQENKLIPIAAFVFWFVFAGFNVWQTNGAIVDKDDYPFLVMNSAELIDLGNWLSDNFPPDSLIALRRQGAVPYYSRMRSLDFLGLTDKTIARKIYQKQDLQEESRSIAEHVVGQGPDILILFSSKSEVIGWSIDGSPADGKLIHLEHLIHDLAFKEGYARLKKIPLGEIEEALLLVKPETVDHSP